MRVSCGIRYYGAGLGVPGASDRVFEPEWELYDLRDDPVEVRNVADDPAYAEVRADLEAKLEQYQRHYRDEPYRGPDTPHPAWGPHDEETLERVRRVFAR
ncbi:sulfatase/phosphatase domain-containing protein [Microbacterium atlanticum]|uniref:sulfatase/phosphatase domain-containing protein n=1 Tax=Microbacterium atlanticum TaxID=2782168 RepID=UPI001E2F3EF9|nr:sulfatase/phosphatase domain-containing protein [Microbacterium atlanticum]